MQSSKTDNFEKKGVCCNPYNLHTSVKTNSLRSVTITDLEILAKKKIDWVTLKMKMCFSCKKHSEPSTKPSTSSGAKNMQNSPEQLEAITVQESPVSGPFAQDCVKNLEKKEKIAALANILKVEMPKLARIDIESDNYRSSTSEKLFQRFYQELKCLFPDAVSTESDDMKEVRNSSPLVLNISD